ncbi:MAG TPA: hypothetical protein PK646_02885 [Bacillota bacterium]|nr:hypothetical protein [Fastidiosipila sp.]HPX92650.1 hypothetical protein [Bacillota bacterium]HQB81017.1 hypothetical protein [Bacillota bacterium]
MRNLVLMTGLKLKLLLRRPLMLAICLILPVLLSLLAGTTLVRNDLTELRAAYVDLAENRESRRLITLLEKSGLGWKRVDRASISRAIELNQLDGVVIIPLNFGDRGAALHLDDVYACEFIAGKNSLAEELIRENYQICALALSTVAKLEKDLFSLTGSSGLTTLDMSRLLEASTEEVRRNGTRLTINFHNLEMGDALPVLDIPDVAVEVLFLSVFSLLGSLLLADAETRRRMRSLPGGLRRDYLASLAALTLSGALQLGSMVGLTLLLMPQVSRPANYLPVMAVLFLLMLAYGQFVALLPADRRFVPASLVLFALLLTGGGLIRLPSLWMQSVGQFTPHGWALTRLAGQDTAVGLIPAASIGVLLLFIAYIAQKKSDYLSA